MHPISIDSGALSDLYHFSRRGSQEARKRGENDAPLKLMMGGVLLVMGCTMLLDNFEKMHGGRGR